MPRRPPIRRLEASLMGVSLAAGLCFACPGPGGPSVDRPRGAPTSRPAPADDARIGEIHRRLDAARKGGGSPPLAATLGPLYGHVQGRVSCPGHLVSELPVWRSPPLVPGSASARPAPAVLFFTTPGGPPPAEAPSKKAGKGSERLILLCAIARHPGTSALEQHVIGVPFGSGAPRIRWLEFPPGHALAEVSAQERRAREDNGTDVTTHVQLIGFPSGRLAGMSILESEEKATRFGESVTTERYHLVRAGSRYFLVERHVRYQGPPAQENGPPQPLGDWRMEHRLYELDARTQASQALKGRALADALALPPLRRFVGSKGRGHPPQD